MLSHADSSVHVICDFDGTITHMNVMDFIASRFATCGLKYSEAWDQGEISTRQEFQLTFATIDVSLEEMASSLHEVPFDDSLGELVDFCHMQGIAFSILSDGLRWYIEAVLKHADIENITLYANEVREAEGGFAFNYPWYSDETPRLAMCKPDVLRDIQKQGKKIVYIGDGPSDFDAVHLVDMIYAKPVLAAYCKEQRLAYKPFTRLSDIIGNWQWFDH